MQNRLVVAVLLVLLLFSILFVRVWYLQIYKFQRFETLSKHNRVSLIPVPPVRGQIFDRNGKVLAENISVYSLEVVPSKVDDMTTVLDKLSQIIPITPWELKRFNESIRAKPSFESQILKLNLTDEQVAAFSVNRQRFPGVFVKGVLQRHYPYAGELAHVLGYVGRISQKDLERIDKKAYRGSKYIGKLGIEAQYEDQLLGQVGYKQVETNAHGQIVQTLDTTQPIAGNDLRLNIDIDLQIAARKALGDKRGSVIAIEPSTGGVLAFVSNPVYDPNLFVNGIDHKNYNQLRDDINRPLLNRALNGRYAPGSTIKGIFALLGLHNGWTRHNRVHCPGWYSLKGSSHRYRCWKRHGHGTLNFIEAITQSCDVYFYQLAHSLGIDKMHDFLTKFGLGKKTGIDLGGEPNGLVPSKRWKKKARNTVWYPGETVIAGIGQGYMLTTPIQLAAVTATLANRGMRIPPRLVKNIIAEPNEETEGDISPPLIEAEAVALNGVADYEQVIDAMHKVVHSATGTARGISRGIQYQMAGKTGTAQVVGIPQGARYDADKLQEFQRDHSLFVGFAPKDKPVIALSVVVENGGSGSKAAAPIARTVMDYYLVGKPEETEAEVAGSVEPQTATAEGGL
ncbi:MAG: penicillin-binding protein 2 [Arenicella sp.]